MELSMCPPITAHLPDRVVARRKVPNDPRHGINQSIQECWCSFGARFHDKWRPPVREFPYFKIRKSPSTRRCKERYSTIIRRPQWVFRPPSLPSTRVRLLERSPQIPQYHDAPNATSPLIRLPALRGPDWSSTRPGSATDPATAADEENARSDAEHVTADAAHPSDVPGNAEPHAANPERTAAPSTAANAAPGRALQRNGGTDEECNGTKSNDDAGLRMDAKPRNGAKHGAAPEAHGRDDCTNGRIRSAYGANDEPNAGAWGRKLTPPSP